MDLFDELENLAISAVYEEPEENGERGTYDPSQGTIKMWQDRFGYTYEEAVAIIGITKTAAAIYFNTTKNPIARTGTYCLSPQTRGGRSPLQYGKGPNSRKPSDYPRVAP